MSAVRAQEAWYGGTRYSPDPRQMNMHIRRAWCDGACGVSKIGEQSLRIGPISLFYKSHKEETGRAITWDNGKWRNALFFVEAKNWDQSVTTFHMSFKMASDEYIAVSFYSSTIQAQTQRCGNQFACCLQSAFKEEKEWIWTARTLDLLVISLFDA